MPRPKRNVDGETVAKAEEELRNIKDSKLSIQLKAIIASADHKVEEVAEILRVSTRSIFRWIARFKKEGVNGLRDQPKGHMRSKLTEDHKKQIEQWILRGENVRGEAVHWIVLSSSVFFFLWNPWWAGLIMVAYALAANGPCIVAQRYNRIRLMKILGAATRRLENTNR